MAAPNPGASSISVAVRVRPFTIREAAQITKCDDGTLFLGDGSLAGVPTPKLGGKGIRPVIKVLDEKCLIFDPPEDNPVQRFSRSVVSNMGKRVKDQTFAFDRVFDENTTQDEVYESTTRGLLDSVMDGYNATVFAYGATGCGKTHTITGTKQQPGIIFLTMQELFEKIAERSDEKHTEVSLSYLEIYNETIRDLLVPAAPGTHKQGLMLREDANGAASVAGLSSHHPQDVQQVMDMIVQGNEMRTISPTAANATSSRSHAVLQINLAQKDRNADVNEPHTMATLSIIDLAGSERASATKNRGERLLEGANINKSLLALGSCINALCDPRKKNHVPYRNSKLTRLLKFSLGGNCKTVMIVCVSPSSAHFDETQNTLRYANRAKNIQTKVTRNVFNVNRHVKDFLVKIDEQMALINELKAQQKDFEAVAFVKFKKQSEKRESIAREAISRLRSSFEFADSERKEKVILMKKKRQVERRISVLQGWVGAFDTICATREDEDMPPSLAAMRKTAHGILLELENSRQHYHQKLSKINWERAIDTALQNSTRLLAEVDGAQDGLDMDSIVREAELLKATAARDALLEVLEQEKAGDGGVMQALLTAQFELISSLHDILSMNEQDAIQHAKSVLRKLLQTCSTAVAQIVKPGETVNVDAFPPTKRGTPKRKKHAAPPLMAEAQYEQPVPKMGSLMPTHIAEPVQSGSPMKASPRRRKAIVVGGRKVGGISFTPKKKSPSKRTVRWRDDTEGAGIADFEKTPQKPTPETPDVSITEESIILPPLPTYLEKDISISTADSSPLGSSPTPTPPKPSLDLKHKSSNRFQAGFLSKKSSDSSIRPPTITPLSSGSDSEASPLRSIEYNNTTNRSPLSKVRTSSSPVVPVETSTPPDSGHNSGSEGENSYSIPVGKQDGAVIAKALRRSGSISRQNNRQSKGGRERSPTVSGSPPNENSVLGTLGSGQARRMGGERREGFVGGSVLSPVKVGVSVLKNAGSIGRRGTVNGEVGRGVGRVLSGAMVGKVRESSAGIGGGVGKWR